MIAYRSRMLEGICNRSAWSILSAIANVNTCRIEVENLFHGNTRAIITARAGSTFGVELAGPAGTRSEIANGGCSGTVA
jgi:hypothetical protein